MAIAKLRLSRFNDSNQFEAVHLETSSDVVLRPDGTTVEHALTEVIQNAAMSVFSFEIVEEGENANLYLNYSGTDSPPEFEMDEDGGLWAVTSASAAENT